MTAGDFRIVHLSDPHVFAPGALGLSHLFDKRLLGGTNALLRRRHVHRPEILRAALERITALAPDHLLVTGDISTVSAEEELEAFRQMLASLPLPESAITVIPGNHDAYVSSVVRRDLFRRIFREHLTPDPAFRRQAWPLVRLRGPVALIGLCTARPSAPMMAVGSLGAGQLARLEATLADPRVSRRVRIVALHHPPQPGVGHWHNRLTDASALRQILSRQGADLVVHGHLHEDLSADLRREDGRAIPVRGVPSVSSAHQTPSRRARFVLYTVRGESISEQRWVHDPRTRSFGEAESPRELDT